MVAMLASSSCVALVPRRSPLGPAFPRVTHFGCERRIAPAACALREKDRASYLDVKTGRSDASGFAFSAKLRGLAWIVTTKGRSATHWRALGEP